MSGLPKQLERIAPGVTFQWQVAQSLSHRPSVQSYLRKKIYGHMATL